ncbi:hypothetical protein Bca52824_023402 [Brassica carinata]|uniref:Uncharacterized protein n=1 Tax=Brassica carinata TaxID=52824 RepID=A0A8X8AT11_BRACI|nr:hypothetical protein Bca52824_023402 [Brassica carinata]
MVCVCSTPHQITASDFNLSTSPSQKPIIDGGLSSLFSGKADDFSSLPHDHRSEDSKDLSFTSSFSYSPARFSYHRREHHQSPISVLHGPVSYSCSPPMRSFHGSYRVGGANGLFNRFVTKAVGSCVDYELGSSSSD